MLGQAWPADPPYEPDPAVYINGLSPSGPIYRIEITRDQYNQLEAYVVKGLSKSIPYFRLITTGSSTVWIETSNPRYFGKDMANVKPITG